MIQGSMLGGPEGGGKPPSTFGGDLKLTFSCETLNADTGQSSLGAQSRRLSFSQKTCCLTWVGNMSRKLSWRDAESKELRPGGRGPVNAGTQ